MKKIFFGMMALVAMVATSCQQDVELGVNGEATTTVSFNLATPQIANRADFSDGTTATHLQYAVYDANGNILNDLAVTDDEIHTSKEVKFQLTTGNTYTVLFWAAAPNAPYTVNLATKTMEVDYTGAVSSDENRDAFYFYSEPFTVSNGMAPIAAELRRPFAQLNIGTNDYDESTSAGYTVTKAKVTTYAYKTLHFDTGVVEGKDMVHFDYAAIPTTQAFPVSGYEYMAMNYLLMANTKETVDVVFTYSDGAVEKQRTVGSVPVQRNYRTNLYGQLITSDLAANVEIKPEYDGAYNNEGLYYIDANGAYHITSADGLKWLAEQVNGGNSFAGVEFILDGDIDFSATRAVAELTPIGTSAHAFSGSFNGQGHTIRNFQITQQEGHAGLFGYITLGGPIKNLTVENVKIVANHYAGAIVGRGYVDIDNCHVNNIDIVLSAKDNDWADKAGGVIGQMLEGGSSVTNSTAKNVTIKGYRDLGGITGMAHSNNTVKGCSVENITIEQDLSVDYESDKSKITTLGGVVGRCSASATCEDNKEQGVDIATLATNASELAVALRPNTCVKVSEGSYNLTSFPAGATIVGSGENTVINATSIITVNGAVNIENAHIAMSNDGYKGFQGGVDLNLKKCTIEGQPFLYGTKATFEECTFVQSVKGAYNVWTYAVKEASFIDCVFNCDGRCVLIYHESPELVQNVSFEGCKFNAATPANDGKAAVEIGASNLTTGLYTVAINNCTSNGFDNGSVSGSTLWNVKNGNRANVTVDGEVAYLAGAELVSNGLWKKGTTYSVTNAEGLATLNSILVADKIGVDASIVLLADIDFTGKTWTPVRSHIDWKNTVNLFNGNGHTISNLTINGQAMFTIFTNTHDVVVKDITFDNAQVNSNGNINTAIIVGQTYNNLLLENVDVKNSTIVGGYKVAALVGTVYNEGPSTITATLKDCDVEDTTVKATAYDFCTTGMVAFVYAGDNDKIEFENCSVSDVKLYGPTTYGYKAHAAIYATGSESLFNKAEGVTVSNVTFENI